MQYEQIKYELEISPTLKLLRKENAALILSFLHKEFKTLQRISIAQLDLESKLADYIDFLQDITLSFHR